jgi:predicted Zn-dependent peptidase
MRTREKWGLGLLVISGGLSAGGPAAAVDNLLAREPPASGVVVRDDVPELGLASATTANGARVHARSIADPDGAAFVNVVLTGGRLRETDADRGIAGAAVLAFSHPHTARLSAAALREHMQGKGLRASGEAAADALVLRLSASQPNLEEALRLGHLLLSEGRIEEEAFRQWKAEAAGQARALDRDLGQQLERLTAAALVANDPLDRPLTAAQIDGLTLGAAQAWLDRQVRESPLEVTVVGNLPVDDLLALGLKYFGSLPRRRLRDSQLAARRQVGQREGPEEQTVKLPGGTSAAAPTATPPTRFARVRVAWRVPAAVDARGERILQLAGQVLRARLERELQKAQPAAVSDSTGLDVTVALPPAFPGRRWLGATMWADPVRAAEAGQVARAVFEKLAQQGPSDSELTRARARLGADARAARGRAAHWARVLEGFDARGQDRVELRKAATDRLTYARKDVVDVLRRCVTDAGRVQIIVTPAT